MQRIYYTIDGKPKPQKRHSPQRPPQKVWHLIAAAKALGVKLVSVMNRDPSKADKCEFNLQSRRYAPKSPIVGPVLLYGAANAEGEAYAVAGWEMCRQLPNIHFLGEKHYTELPAYMSHMDVNTMCYRSTGEGWWKDIYPLKMHEYLASGKPVVSAALQSVQPFSHVIDIAQTTEEWGAALKLALSGGVGTVEERREVAEENSWDRRVNQLDGWLLEMVGKSQTKL